MSSKVEDFVAMANEMEFVEKGAKKRSAIVHRDDGRLVISDWETDDEATWFSREEALRLAHWIIAVYGEKS